MVQRSESARRLILTLMLLSLLTGSLSVACRDDPPPTPQCVLPNVNWTDDPGLKRDKWIIDPYTIGLYDFTNVEGLSIDRKTGQSVFSEKVSIQEKDDAHGAYFPVTGGTVSLEDAFCLEGLKALSIEMWVYIEPEQQSPIPILAQLYSEERVKGFNIQQTAAYFELYLRNNINRNRWEFGWVVSATSRNIDECYRNFTTTKEDHYWKGYLGDWTYVVATFEGSQLSLYLNGELASSTLCNAQLLTRLSTFFIGNGVRKLPEDLPNYFHGTIAGVRVSNVARSEEAIQAVYDAADGEPTL